MRKAYVPSAAAIRNTPVHNGRRDDNMSAFVDAQCRADLDNDGREDDGTNRMRNKRAHEARKRRERDLRRFAHKFYVILYQTCLVMHL
jgi:hypothetical protein